MSSPTELYLPPTFPYPIKITAHAVGLSSSVERGARLLSYSFTHKSVDAGTELRFGTWDSSIEGTVNKWNFRPGDIISARRARDIPAVTIDEPCKHGVQLGGLCCLCGKDMTSYDYTGFSDASRASIQMTHLANGPTVSLEEAQRIERETADHLLKSRKLSLIVDLDQTIVHATVDPTVGEWIAEGEAWEARRAARATSDKGAEGDTNETMPDVDDEVNPNWEALKDVKRFRLGPEALGQPKPRGLNGKGKEKALENEGCMYYIKPRPGWQEFLRTVSTKFEMHVYTMGTRAYAEEVCAAIDPDGKLFGGRILSRDESGSLTQKSLQRLFPCDQSMVVIIDDRADVWEWSPNLVKVIPYDFFIGIGDINSSFLPKLNPLTPILPPMPPLVGIQQSSSETIESPDNISLPSTSLGSSIADATLDMSDDPSVSDDNDELTKKDMLNRNTLVLEAQVEERPLAKKQEELQEAASAGGVNPDAPVSDKVSTGNPSVKDKVPRKALLKNDDYELIRVKKFLEEVHTQFYDAFDARPKQIGPKRKTHKGPHPPIAYDVRTIIPRLRMNTLDGVHILFSSVIPLDTRPEYAEIWRTAHAFGAKCYTDLSSRITHVVAAKRGTVKVDAARRQGGIKIVWLSWLTDSIALWERQDETPYLMDPDPPIRTRPASPPSDAHQISSDPEPDADDWDDNQRVSAVRSLELDEVDWDEVNNEVEAAMNESDDEDGQSERSGIRSGNVSDDDESVSATSSVHSSPKRRKRLRSITPSDRGSNDSDPDDLLRSPLAKRKKLALNRSTSSKLKEAISADDLVQDLAGDEQMITPAVSPKATDDSSNSDSTTSSEDEEMDEEDDFLARELEEDWG